MGRADCWFINLSSPVSPFRNCWEWLSNLLMISRIRSIDLYGNSQGRLLFRITQVLLWKAEAAQVITRCLSLSASQSETNLQLVNDSWSKGKFFSLLPVFCCPSTQYYEPWTWVVFKLKIFSSPAWFVRSEPPSLAEVINFTLEADSSSPVVFCTCKCPIISEPCRDSRCCQYVWGQVNSMFCPCEREEKKHGNGSHHSLQSWQKLNLWSSGPK